MKTLVTGGAGFIGSHLCEALLAEGHSVTALDDLSTGRPSNLAQLSGNAAFQLIAGDVRDEAVVARALDGCDEVYHLAAAVGAALVLKQPVRTLDVNVNGSAAVFAAATRTGARVFLASTSEVYGRSATAQQCEDDDLGFGPSTRPRWGYACSKALDEWLALAHATEHGLHVVIGRIFNTTGPRQLGDYGMVLPRFVAAAVQGRPLLIHGDGSQTRSFAHVRDTVGGIRALMQCPAATGQVVNIGSAEEICILELAQRVVRIADSKSELRCIAPQDARADGYEELPRRRPSLSKLHSLTGFAPRVTLDEVISELCRAAQRG